MKAFVSGQLQEKERIREIYAQLDVIGLDITHDWTRTDNLGSYSQDTVEAGRRAELDVNGVRDADIYILMTDNQFTGKGMYVELGAALALAGQFGWPKIFLVGPMNHESIFYYHPLVKRFANIKTCLQHIQYTLAHTADLIDRSLDIPLAFTDSQITDTKSAVHKSYKNVRKRRKPLVKQMKRLRRED